MPGLRVTVERRGSIKADKLKRTEELTLAVAQHLRTEVDLCFREQRDPWGNAWEELTAVTLGRRRGTRAQILSDTGVLRNSIAAMAEGKSATIGTADIRAGTHQFGAAQGAYGTMKNGSPIPWGDIPPRPFMPLDPNGDLDLPEDWKEDVEAVIRQWVEKAVG